jgi:hypothetical protein
MTNLGNQVNNAAEKFIDQMVEHSLDNTKQLLKLDSAGNINTPTNSVPDPKAPTVTNSVYKALPYSKVGQL